MHLEDLVLIDGKRLSIGNLITIRQGEPVFSPLTGAFEPSPMELIKLAGQNNSWACCFFKSSDKSCGIYQHRPLECRLLKCWDPGELIGKIYRNAIKRTDIIVKANLANKWLIEHKEKCSYAELSQLAVRIQKNNDLTALAAGTEMINQDINLRGQAIRALKLNLAEELFYFGRPMFKSLSYFGLRIMENKNILEIVLKNDLI